MTAAVHYEDRPANPGWLKRAEAWLDERGRPAWIVAMVLGFILPSGNVLVHVFKNLRSSNMDVEGFVDLLGNVFDFFPRILQPNEGVFRGADTAC